jgi:hypothetical protein
VRGRFGWLLAGLGIAAAVVARWRARAPLHAPLPPPSPPSDQAEELRRRIAESRELVDEREEFEGAETPVDEADPASRRREVHQRGRTAVDRMRGNGDGS